MHLSDLTSPQLRNLSKDTPIVFPVAALEQHGAHLPLFTDSLLLGELIRRAAPSFAHSVVFAPLLWLGNSDHHLDFPGTLSAAPRTYLDILGGLMENFLQHGFKRLVFVNGHGGNDVPGRQAVFEIRQKHRTEPDILLLFATYWNLGGVAPNSVASLVQQEMGHACEWETSMILRLSPDLVGPLAKLQPVPFAPGFAPAHRAWITPDRTASGHIGNPAVATAEKGEALFRVFTEQLVNFLTRVVHWNGRDWNG